MKKNPKVAPHNPMIGNITITEKSFGPKSLYKQLKFSIQDGEKIGVIGRNGVGKSTLLGILSGEDCDFSGDISYKRGLVVIATRQEHHDVDNQSVLEYILHDLPEYSHLKHIMDTYPEEMGEDMRKITEYSEALERFDALGYHTIEESIIRELETFQIEEKKSRSLLRSLSGGQKRLVEIVKVMHANAQLALIDEPTNHMDYVAKGQFIDWVKASGEAMLIITHDRDVLERVDRIIEIKDGKVHSFKGNYAAYLRQNATTTTTQMHDFEVVQRQVANLKSKVIQFRRLKERARDPDTIKQFKRRENEATKQLAELQKIKKPTFWIDKESAEDLAYKVSENYQKFKTRNISIQGMNQKESRSSNILVDAQKVSLGYDKPLFTGITLQLKEGERVELRGRNGAGKTTLIKAILAAAAGKKMETLQQGKIMTKNQLNIGVYEQEVEKSYFSLPLAGAIERMYLDKNLSISNQKIKQLLASYLFSPADALIPVAQLSGGQKARFQLISMLAREPQLLILDEPTNHLDLPSIEELENALSKYAGAVIYVSHDNHFRKNIPAEVIEIKSV